MPKGNPGTDHRPGRLRRRGQDDRDLRPAGALRSRGGQGVRGRRDHPQARHAGAGRQGDAGQGGRRRGGRRAGLPYRRDRRDRGRRGHRVPRVRQGGQHLPDRRADRVQGLRTRPRPSSTTCVRPRVRRCWRKRALPSPSGRRDTSPARVPLLAGGARCPRPALPAAAPGRAAGPGAVGATRLRCSAARRPGRRWACRWSPPPSRWSWRSSSAYPWPGCSPGPDCAGRRCCGRWSPCRWCCRPWSAGWPCSPCSAGPACSAGRCTR